MSSRSAPTAATSRAPSGGHPNKILWYDPAWSKDGRRLAVTAGSWPTGTILYADVVVIDTKTGRQAACARSDGESPVHGSPSWAPDSRRLVFVNYEHGAGGSLYVARVGSPTCTRITPEYRGSYDDSPAWSPDGSTIAFARTQSGGTHLFLIRPDGSGLRQLLRTPAKNPSWSPDGKRLAFDNGHRIATVDKSGGDLRYLTAANNAADPAWSPDGRTVAFVQHGDIWLVNATGEGLRLLVRHADQPAWKPG